MWTLKISMNGDFTVLLRNLLLYLVTTPVKVFFSLSICAKNSCSCSLCILILLLLCTSKEECTLFVIIFQVTEDDSGPSSTVFSNLNQINFLDIFPRVFFSMKTSGILKDKQLRCFKYLHHLFQKVMVIFNWKKKKQTKLLFPIVPK